MRLFVHGQIVELARYEGLEFRAKLSNETEVYAGSVRSAGMAYSYVFEEVTQATELHDACVELSKEETENSKVIGVYANAYDIFVRLMNLQTKKEYNIHCQKYLIDTDGYDDSGYTFDGVTYFSYR